MIWRNRIRSLALRLTNLAVGAAYYPIRAWNRKQADIPVTILTYHKICSAPDAGWSVSPENFSRQMEFLSGNGYCVLGLNDYMRLRERGEKFHCPTVILSFDDGYENVFCNAYPVLERHHFPAVLFLVPNLIGSHNMFPWDSGKEQYRGELLPLTWEQVDAMRKGMIEFGSHTLNHPHLARLSAPEVEREVVESRLRLEERLGMPIETFAYPGGIRRYADFSDATREALLRAGYRLACTSEIGRNGAASDLMQLRRIFVEGKDSLRIFAAKVEGAFDWLFYGQQVFQRVFPDPSNY